MYYGLRGTFLSQKFVYMTRASIFFQRCQFVAGEFSIRALKTKAQHTRGDLNSSANAPVILART